MFWIEVEFLYEVDHLDSAALLGATLAGKLAQLFRHFVEQGDLKQRSKR